MVLFYILASTVIISLISLVGLLAFVVRDEVLKRFLLWLVGFSAGALLGSAFFHLLPESLELNDEITAFGFVILGFLVFFSLERFLYWRHCHTETGECDVHMFTYLNLVGDGLHNFIDGVLIAAAFLSSLKLGVITSVAVILHEIPQEFGDFGVLIYGGFSKVKALKYNFYSACSSIAGALAGYFLINSFNWMTGFLLPFTAGGFIYIASADLIPELHKEHNPRKSVVSALFFAIGIVFMLFVKLQFG